MWRLPLKFSEVFVSMPGVFLSTLIVKFQRIISRMCVYRNTPDVLTNTSLNLGGVTPLNLGAPPNLGVFNMGVLNTIIV